MNEFKMLRDNVDLENSQLYRKYKYCFYDNAHRSRMCDLISIDHRIAQNIPMFCAGFYASAYEDVYIYFKLYVIENPCWYSYGDVQHVRESNRKLYYLLRDICDIIYRNRVRMVRKFIPINNPNHKRWYIPVITNVILQEVL